MNPWDDLEMEAAARADAAEAVAWHHEMNDQPDLEHEAGETFEVWGGAKGIGTGFYEGPVPIGGPRVLPDHGGRATRYPGALKRPWIDGPTVAALIMLGTVLAPVAALVAWLARRLKVVRR